MTENNWVANFRYVVSFQDFVQSVFNFKIQQGKSCYEHVIT